MEIARSVVLAMLLGSMIVLSIGCTLLRTEGEPQEGTASPPVVDAAPTGPPPGHVEPTNYVVRERIILTSEQEPAKSATPKSPVKKAKKTKANKKTSASAETSSSTNVTPN